MRPIDLFIEKQLSDSRADRADQKISPGPVQDSFNLAMLGMAPDRLSERELRKIEEEMERDGGSQRDKFALISIAFCSPLMLLGMGATLAMTDDIKLNRFSKLENSLQNRIQLQRSNYAASAEAAMRQRKLETAIEPLDLTRVERKTPAEEQASRPAEKVEKKAPVKESSERPVVVAKKAPKDKIRFEKLMKEKQALTDYMEEMRGKLSLKSVSNLMARIEQIEKSIKKIC